MITVVAVALLLEEFIEHLKTQFAWFKGDLIHAVKYAAGVGLAFGFDLGLFGGNEIVDHALTGLALGAGASFVNAAIERLAGNTNRWA